MQTKITMWLEKNKPTRVRMTKHEEFYLEDMTGLLSDLAKKKPKEKEVDSATRHGKNDTSS